MLWLMQSYAFTAQQAQGLVPELGSPPGFDSSKLKIHLNSNEIKDLVA
ncbi:hypothetical protein [Rhodoferax sp. PAMC 29310]|nr:hypothetical protein [Rhodoferax sp. PAMC 29310]